MKQSSGNTIFRKEILIGIVMILSVISGYSYFHVHSHVGMILYNFIILSGVLVLGYRCAGTSVFIKVHATKQCRFARDDANTTS